MPTQFNPSISIFAALALALFLPGAVSAQKESVNPGGNSGFTNPEMKVEDYSTRFEAESREVFRERAKVIAALDLKPGMAIADVGAGTGIYAIPFAEAVGPQGKVHAIDLSPTFIEHLTKQSQTRGLKQLQPRLGESRTVGLPENSVDLVFTSDTYHHFEFPKDVLASAYKAIKSGGQFVVIDFDREPGKSREWLLDHIRAGKAEVKAEVTAAGFRFVDEVMIDGFKETYFLRFAKP
jgi:ubiquinone/menaquinone biosynthesis C-methylase UbiE